MVNTRILKQEFDYYTPASIRDALILLNDHVEDAKIIAGGTDLLVQMKQEIIFPNKLICIQKIAELSNIKKDEALKLGAAVVLRDALLYFEKDKRFMALSDALATLAEIQVRNMGTIGGNICNASPAADSGPPLLIHDANVKIESVRGSRTLPLYEFFKDVNKTDLVPNEIMTEIIVPYPHDKTGSAFMKLARVGADISKLSCAVMVERHEDICSSCRIALGSVAPMPLRIKPAEDFLKGKKVDEVLLNETGQIISNEVKPIGDIRSTIEYRKSVAAVLFKDVFQKAWKRAEQTL